MLLIGQVLARIFFRLGLGMGFSKLESIGQIASFERRLRGAAPTPLTLPYPFRTSTRTGWGGKETSETWPNICILGGIYPGYSWILACAKLEPKNMAKHFQIGIIYCLAYYFVRTAFFSWSHLEAFGLSSHYCCVVVFDTGFLGHIPWFERCVEEGRSLPSDTIHPESVLILHPREIQLMRSQTVRRSKPNNRN